MLISVVDDYPWSISIIIKEQEQGFIPSHDGLLSSQFIIGDTFDWVRAIVVRSQSQKRAEKYNQSCSGGKLRSHSVNSTRHDRLSKLTNLKVSQRSRGFPSLVRVKIRFEVSRFTVNNVSGRQVSRLDRFGRRLRQ